LFFIKLLFVFRFYFQKFFDLMHGLQLVRLCVYARHPLSLPPLSVLAWLSILRFRIIILVFSIHDPTEVAIQKMIEASQRMITMNSQGKLGGMSPPVKRHLELPIKTLENAARDSEKLEQLLKSKQRQKEEQQK
jgi:hypothetical protein